MWHDDHAPPHIHVEYQGFEAMVRIEGGLVHKGRLPRKAALIVKEWCLHHQEELLLSGRGAGHPTPPPFGTHRALFRQWARDIIIHLFVWFRKGYDKS
jgi:hypothetical protein